MLRKILIASVFTLASSAIAQAGCGIEKGDVRILGNEFPAIQTVAKGAMACADDKLKVTANLTKEHRDLQVAAMTANPAEYTVAIVANSSIVPLMNDGLIRPLNDLVEKYGQQLKKNHPDVKVIILSMFEDSEHIEQALGQGASGYVVKSINPLDLPSTIRQVVEGTVYHPRGRGGGEGAEPQPAQNPGGLTDRELSILKLVAEGLSNLDIASKLYVTEQTVKFHLSNIYRKMGCSKRAEAIATARALNWVA